MPVVFSEIGVISSLDGHPDWQSICCSSMSRCVNRLENGESNVGASNSIIECALTGDRADAQTEEGEEMEKAPQAGAQGRYRAQTAVSHSALSAIFRSSAGLWSTGLLGLSKRPGDRLEGAAGNWLGIRSRYPFGRDLTIGQDMRLETGVYLRYQRPFLVP